MRVLIVSERARPADVVCRALRRAGALTDVATRGEDALWMSASTGYDAVVMDARLPDAGGRETCLRIRGEDILTPILILSDEDDPADRVAALDAGADDYLVEPFVVEELLARLRALVRRGEGRRPTVLRVGSLCLDPATRRVWRGVVEIGLSTKEFDVLEVFMRSPDVVLGRLDLLEGAWDNGYENRSNVISVHVRHLRDKLDRPFGLESIETVRGAGYRLRADATPRSREDGSVLSTP